MALIKYDIMDTQTADKLTKAFTKKAAQIFGLRQKDINVNYFGNGEFGLHVGHLGHYDFVMKDGSKKSELEFSQDDLSDLQNVKKIVKS